MWLREQGPSQVRWSLCGRPTIREEGDAEGLNVLQYNDFSLICMYS